MSDQLIIHTDGGSRGNPGNAAIGVHVTDQKNNVICQISKRIGTATNNVAEYSAVIEALRWIKEHKKTTGSVKKISFFMDSQLLQLQLTGVYKVKNETLRSLLFQIRLLEQEVASPIYYHHIMREHNKKADQLVNQALDALEY